MREGNDDVYGKEVNTWRSVFQHTGEVCKHTHTPHYTFLRMKKMCCKYDRCCVFGTRCRYVDRNPPCYHRNMRDRACTYRRGCIPASWRIRTPGQQGHVDGENKKIGLLVGDAMFKVASAACAPSSSEDDKKIMNEKQQLTHARMTPSPATTGHSLSAVEYVLDGQIDIVANAAPCNFDPIRQGRQGTLRE